MKTRASGVILAACVFLASVYARTSGIHSAEQPAVISAAAPWYPDVAKAARVSGDVIVEVEIAPSGTVSAARSIEGHTLLRQRSVEAAARWKFAAAEKAGARKARLTFSFHLPKRREDEVPPLFEPPYKVVVASFTCCIM